MHDWKDEIRNRLAGLKLEPTREDEIVEELAQHLEDRYQELLANGLSQEQAHRVTFDELSDNEFLSQELRLIERPATNEPVILGARRRNMIGDLWQDLRYGLRILRRSPSFTVVAVLSLALCIGANTAIFSVIDALMLRKLPVNSPDQLVTFEQLLPDGSRQYNFSYLDFERFQELTQIFSSMSVTSWADGYNVTINGAGGIDEGLARVSLVTGSYFSTLGVNARIGRTLSEDDDRVLGGHPVTVISNGYWERRFGRAPDIVGRTLTLYGTTYTIIGVTPPGFSGDWVGWPTDLWIPTAMISQVHPELGPKLPRSRLQYKIIARLQSGVTIHQAQAVGEAFHQQLQKEPPSNTGVIPQSRFEVVSAATGYSPQREFFAQPLTLLMIMVGVLLLIACANVANLLLARAAGRQREIAVRLAVGAGRGRIVRQLLTESVLLATLGGVLGLPLAWWGMDILAMFARSGPVGGVTSGVQSLELDLRMDGRILAFTIAISLLTSILFGLAPAFRGSKVSLLSGLNGRGLVDTDGFRGKLGLRKLLVIMQVALSLVLLIGAGLFIRTLSNLKSQDLGFDRQHLLLVWANPGHTGRQGPELVSLWETVQERISSLPGIVSASPSVEGLLPGGSTGGPLIQVEGSTPNANEETRVQTTMTIGTRFFETVGQRLLAGREFTGLDTASAPLVVIINESLARHFFGSENPIGRRLTIARSNYPPMQIVGVGEDAKQTPREASSMRLYYPLGQNIRRLSRSMCLAVRVAGSPTSVAASVRQELRDIDPGLPVLKIDTIEEQLDGVLFQERLITELAISFGALAVLLACIGLYGMISYSVVRRTNEIGIRLALGATPSKVLQMVLKESLLLVLIATVIGICATLATTRLISTMLFGVSTADPLTIAAATLLMIVVAALAAFLPARQASRVDPMVALRYE